MAVLNRSLFVFILHTKPFPIEIAVSVEGFACFVCMDLLQLTNNCGLQDGKSLNQRGNFNGKLSGVLDLYKKWSWDTNRNRFSPRNVREITSSVYGRTILGQLYFLSKSKLKKGVRPLLGTLGINSYQADNSVLDVELLEDDGHYPETTSSSHHCQSSLNPSFLKIKPAVL